MRDSISNTAEFGDLTRGPKVIGPEVKVAMKEVLRQIQDGEFTREWMLENQVGRPVFTSLKRQGEEHQIEKVGKEVRGLMPQFRDLCD